MGAFGSFSQAQGKRKGLKELLGCTQIEGSDGGEREQGERGNLCVCVLGGREVHSLLVCDVFSWISNSGCFLAYQSLVVLL